MVQPEGQDDKKENGGAETAGATSADGFHHVRHRPAVTQGITERINTGEGRIYVTINEDEFGICEVFSTIGKAGSMRGPVRAGKSTYIISGVVRVDPQEVVSELKGISRPNPSGKWRAHPLYAGCRYAQIERYVCHAGEMLSWTSPRSLPSGRRAPTGDSSNGVKTSTTCPEWFNGCT